jgi:hypothetical protein
LARVQFPFACVPKDLAEDSMFPFKGADALFVEISFKLGGKGMLGAQTRLGISPVRPTTTRPETFHHRSC